MLAAQAGVHLRQREWKMLMALWLQKYTSACKIFPLGPAPWKGCKLAKHYLLYFQMVFPTSEHTLFLEVLYLNKLTTFMKIYLKPSNKQQKPKSKPDNLYRFYVWYIYSFFFWIKILSRLFAHLGHHRF